MFPERGEKKWNESRSVVSNSLQPHGLYNPWNSPSQYTGVSSLSLLQEIFPTQGSNPSLLYCRQILYPLSHKGSPCIISRLEFFFGQKPVHIIGPFFYCTICVFPYRDCLCLSDTNSLPVTWLNNFVSSKFISCLLITLWCLVIHKFSISMLQTYQFFLYDRHVTDIFRMFSLTWDPKKYFPLKFFLNFHLSNEVFFHWSATDFVWCDVGIQFYFFIHINS